MRPQNVVAPQDKLSNLQVIYDAGDWSVADFTWIHDQNERRTRIGIRWNGEENELGNPQSSGHATWFILPENLIADFIGLYARRRANRPTAGDDF